MYELFFYKLHVEKKERQCLCTNRFHFFFRSLTSKKLFFCTSCTQVHDLSTPAGHKSRYLKRSDFVLNKVIGMVVYLCVLQRYFDVTGLELFTCCIVTYFPKEF